MASLLRAYGLEDEKSATVQAKLRVVLPALVSFVASCLELGRASEASAKLGDHSEETDPLKGEAQWHISPPLGSPPPSARGPRRHIGPVLSQNDRQVSKYEAQNTSITVASVEWPTTGMETQALAKRIPSGILGKDDMAITEEKKLELVQSLPYFSSLDDATVRRVVGSLETRYYCKDEEIASPGDQEAGLHIIVRGKARVSAMKEVAVLSPGGVFGESLLKIGGSFRGNSSQGGCEEGVIESLEACSGEVVTLRLPPEVFRGWDRQSRMLMKAKCRERVRGVSYDDHAYESSGKVVRAESEEDRELVMDAVRSNTNIEEVLKLTDDQCAMMPRIAERRSFAKGQTVFQKGDIGDAFYIVQDGVFTTVLDSPGEAQKKKLRSGDSFGELALVYNAPRSLTVECQQAGHLWRITKGAFLEVVHARDVGRWAEYKALIEAVPLFQDLGGPQTDELCKAMDVEVLTRGQEVVTQGEVGDSFYLIFEGTCEVIEDGVVKRTSTKGDFFGEKALLEDVPRSASVRVKSDSCSVLVVDRTAFDALRVHFKHWDPSTRTSRPRANIQLAPQATTASTQQRADPIPTELLQRVGFMGQGGFGFVTLERHRITKKLYALKAMSKGHIVDSRLVQAVKNEVTCQYALKSDFIVRLISTHQDKSNLYLLLEPCFGGELLDVYNDNSLWGSLEHARFYAASVTLGLEHMHAKKIIYRDLKLENCLLTSQGQLKLTDFGIAKVVIGKTYTVCGTADYFAPETLRQRGHNRAVDWWALGVLIFIQMTGRSPFEADEVMEVYKNIIKGFAKIPKPADISQVCFGLVTSLCKKRPEERLTMQAGGVKNLKQHRFFAGVDWKELAEGKANPPWKPSLDEETTSQRLAQQAPREAPTFGSYEDDGDIWEDCFGALI